MEESKGLSWRVGERGGGSEEGKGYRGEGKEGEQNWQERKVR